MTGKNRLAIGICLLVVVAGCSGLSGEETATPATTDTDERSIVSVSDHTAALRDAGSFTYNRTVKRTYLDSGYTQTQRDTARVNLETGRLAYEHIPLGGSTTNTYIASNGSVYAKEGGRYTDDPVHRQNASSFLDPEFETLWSWFEFSRVGSTTLDGIAVREYAATDTDQIEELPLDTATTEITSLDARVYVSDAGWVKQAGYNFTAESEGERVVFTEQIEYNHVGETTVTQPEWLPESRRAIAEADFDDIITRTYHGETANATLTVTAEAYHHDNSNRFEVAAEDPAYDRERAVSAYIDVYYPDDAANVSLTISYDESAIPNGDESDLAMYWREDVLTFRKLDSTVDTANNTVTATLNTDGNYYSYVVMAPPASD